MTDFLANNYGAIIQNMLTVVMVASLGWHFWVGWKATRQAMDKSYEKTGDSKYFKISYFQYAWYIPQRFRKGMEEEYEIANDYSRLPTIIFVATFLVSITLANMFGVL